MGQIRLPFKWRRLPARYGELLLPLVLSVMMTAIVSAIATLRTAGLHANFIHIWMNTWLIACLIAYPTILVVLPLARRLISLIVEPDSD